MDNSNQDKLRGLVGPSNSPAGPIPQSWDQPSPPPPPPPAPELTTSRPMPASSHAPQQTQGQPPIVAPRNGKGTAALVCGIIGLVPFPVTGFWLSLIAIVLGVQGKKRAREGLATNHSVAQAGFILGIIGMGIQALLGLAIALS